jgi:outer membrane protein TolC
MLKAVLLSCLSASSVFAQGLTLDAVLREALQNNPGYLASRSDLGFAENAYSSQGTAGYLPSVAASGGLGWSKLDTRQERVTGAPPVRTTESVDGAESRTRTAGLNANWTLFEGFAGLLNQRRLRLERDQARALENLTREDLLRRAALSYADLARQARLRDVRDTLLRLSDERFRILNSRIASGSAARPEWLEGQVDRNADRAALVQQEAALHAARLALANALGRETPVAGRPEEDALPSGTLDFAALRGGLEGRQPEVKLAEAEKTLASIYLNQALAPLYPRLEANAGYNLTLASNDAGTLRENRTIGPSAGLQLTVPLFDGEFPWRVRARGRHAVTAAEQRLREAQFSARAEVDRAYAAWTAIDSAATLEREGLGYAKENLDLTFRRWKTGGLSYLEARLAQVKYLDAFTRAENTDYEAFRARLDVLRAAGRMDILLEEAREQARAEASANP